MRTGSTLLLAGALALANTFHPTAQAVHEEFGDWETLFDGTSTGQWRGYKTDSFPVKGWKVEDRALKTIVGGQVKDLVTLKQYSDFELELEWKIAPGGNSGIMYRVTEDFPLPWHTGPELQVLDDSKHKDGPNPKTSAGSLYALLAPTNKVLKPAGEWNHTRLLAIGNRVEHWLNGRKVLEYELNSPELNTLVAASKFSDKPRFGKETTGHILLQHHRDEVWYRNIRIRTVEPARAANTLTPEEISAGWRLLFDGKTTEGWRGFRKTRFPESGWVVEDGCLKLLKNGRGGDIVSVEQFLDFELEWDWRISRRGNNGIKYLVTEARNEGVGHEYQMLDDGRSPSKQTTASFYDVLPPTSPVPVKPAGEWNHSRLVIQGNRVEHWLNGKEVLTYHLGSPELKAAIADSKFMDTPGFGDKIKGHILLTDHHDETWFRNIRIRELPPTLVHKEPAQAPPNP